MTRGGLLIALLVCTGVCARPYSGRVLIAEETLLQAADRGIPYQRKLDAALDGSAVAIAEFILIGKKLDTAGAYFHFFHVYEVAELVGDARFASAVKALNQPDLRTLADGLREARGWLKGRRLFSVAFPTTFAHLRRSVKTGDF